MDVKITNHSWEAIGEMEAKVRKALNECGMVAERYAKEDCPVDTGNLRNSITHMVDSGGKKAYVGTPVEYATYVEYGTGIHAVKGGRQTPWSYQDGKGVWHTTSGQTARPFIKPAAANHIDEYKQIIKSTLEE